MTGDEKESIILEGVQKISGADTLITKAIVVYELIDARGVRGLGMLYTDGVAVWDRMGMLQFALDNCDAADMECEDE